MGSYIVFHHMNEVLSPHQESMKAKPKLKEFEDSCDRGGCSYTELPAYS